MRDMLVAGGATSGSREVGNNQQFGEAMAIYTQIVKASHMLDYETVMTSYNNASAAAAAGTPWDDRSPVNILKRLALGTALFFAVPQSHRYA